MKQKDIQDSIINSQPSDADAQSDQLAVLQLKVSELENNWKRALADYQNLQKRFNEEKAQIITYANSTLILKLLFVMDNLEMVAKHSTDQGLILSVKTFSTVLQEEGVEELPVLGKEFNPETMDAIEKVPGEENSVVEVVQKGYVLNKNGVVSKILRPARVKVGSGLANSETTEKEENA